MMKKIVGVIVFVVCLCFFPSHVYAYGIEHYYMDVTVLENGDLQVKEAFSLNGSYQGMERIIQYQNPNALEFKGDLDSFYGSTLHNGSGLTLGQIRAMDQGSVIDFSLLEKSGKVFEKVDSAESGMFGVYTERFMDDGSVYRIYNPSTMHQMFYLEYTIHDMAIVFDDVAEIGWNIFSDAFNESIGMLDVMIHIPGNQEILRAWAHGPLYGEVELLGMDTIHLTIEDVDANTPMDVRFVFDKNLLVHPLKVVSMNGLDSILEVEKQLADAANLEREQIRAELKKEQKKKEFLGICYSVGHVIYLGILVWLIIYVYKKHDREYASLFRAKYFRDIPSEDTPASVGYLMRKKITDDDLSASVLYLIYQKVITFKKIDQNNYQLYYHKNVAHNSVDKILCHMIFGDSLVTTLKDFKKKAKKGYVGILKDYDSWKSLSLSEAEAQGFYESKSRIKFFGDVYVILGIALAFMGFIYAPFTACCVLLISLLAFLYFQLFTKRTVKGNELYLKWKALKNFMKDFGTMDQKELPEIVLWEKYLVYAVTLGCADKLSKAMEVRIREYSDTDSFLLERVSTMHDMMVFQHVMDRSVHGVISNAQSAHASAIASSSNSSSGGFGGGFSSGGGSFGGGSGGGRF